MGGMSDDLRRLLGLDEGEELKLLDRVEVSDDGVGHGLRGSLP